MPLNLKLDAKKMESMDQAVKDYQAGDPEVEARVLGWIRELLARGATQAEVARFFQDRSMPLPRRWLRDAIRKAKEAPPDPPGQQTVVGDGASQTSQSTNGSTPSAADGGTPAKAKVRRVGDEEIA